VSHQIEETKRGNDQRYVEGESLNRPFDIEVRDLLECEDVPRVLDRGRPIGPNQMSQQLVQLHCGNGYQHLRGAMTAGDGVTNAIHAAILRRVTLYPWEPCCSSPFF
jgi:hypothetical protein